MRTIYHPYTPSRQDPGFLERTATGRDKLLSALLAGIEQESRQSEHRLLIGTQGIGKSHIIARLTAQEEKVLLRESNISMRTYYNQSGDRGWVWII